MTDRLRQVGERLETVAQLEMVMTAMRGIAATHLREAHAQLPGIRAYAKTIGMAISDVMAFMPSQSTDAVEPDAAATELLIVLSAEQGFAGTFNDRIMDEVVLRPHNTGSISVLLVGNRGISLAHQFLIEAIVLSLIGGLLGIILGMILAITGASFLRVPFTPIPALSLSHLYSRPLWELYSATCQRDVLPDLTLLKLCGISCVLRSSTLRLCILHLSDSMDACCLRCSAIDRSPQYKLLKQPCWLKIT